MKNSKSKKVTKKGEYYFAKGFKVLVSCVKKNRYSLFYIQVSLGNPGFFQRGNSPSMQLYSLKMKYAIDITS